MDSTYLSKLFYLLNLGVYLYHKKNSHTSNLKLIIIKNKNKNKNKKVIYKFYILLFVNIYFLKSQK